jgi:hypothetical protein
MTLLMQLRCLLGRMETLLRLLRDLQESFGICILIFAIDDPGSLRNIPMVRLHRPAFTISFTVENSGSVFGGEVRCCPLELVFIYCTEKKTHIFNVDPAALCEFPNFRW